MSGCVGGESAQGEGEGESARVCLLRLARAKLTNTTTTTTPTRRRKKPPNKHSAGLNCGRWDYVFSFIKKFRNRADKVLPNRGDVTMTSPFMDAYVRLLIRTCHARGCHAMGGMAAQIPIKHDAAANEAALAKVCCFAAACAGAAAAWGWVCARGRAWCVCVRAALRCAARAGDDDRAAPLQHRPSSTPTHQTTPPPPHTHTPHTPARTHPHTHKTGARRQAARGARGARRHVGRAPRARQGRARRV